MTNWDFFTDLPAYHPIADADNLYEGFCKARRGSHWKGQVQSFRWNALREIGRLQEELDHMQRGEEGAYELSEYSRFMVMERGKTRAITALKMRDRVVKHVLNDLYLIPHIRPHLIYDNGASLKGKGVSFTRSRLVAHLEKFYKEYQTNEGYIMILDFSGYYDNIDHEVAMQMIEAYEPDSFARKLTKQAYDSFKIDVSYMSSSEFARAKHEKFSTVEYRKAGHDRCHDGDLFLNRSLSVGDQTSQITAIAFATPIDQLIKTVCGFRYYGRYMDDLYVIARTKEELLTLLAKISAMSERMRMFLNTKKTRILKLARTFTFMQYKYYLKKDGHVVVRMRSKTLTRMRRKLRRLHDRVEQGRTRLLKVEEMFRGWIANYAFLMSRFQRERLIELYRTLFGGGLDSWMKLRLIM